MALTTADKEWIKLVTEKVSYEVNKSVLATHIKNCPHGINLKIRKAFVVGICIGAGLAAGGVGGGVAVFIGKIVGAL